MTYEPELLVAQPNFTINVLSSLHWRISWDDALWRGCPLSFTGMSIVANHVCH